MLDSMGSGYQVRAWLDSDRALVDDELATIPSDSQL